MVQRIFLSYRRDDQPGYAARLGDDLKIAFGDVVFRDVDGILAGEDWQPVLKRKVSKAEVVIAIIGPKWESSLIQRGDVNTIDNVRLELNTAKDQGLHVIPVILEGVELPSSDTLGDLAWLLNKQGHRLSDTQNRWHFDVAQLTDHIVRLTSLRKKRKFIKAKSQLILAGLIVLVTLLSWLLSNQLPSQIAPKSQIVDTANMEQSEDLSSQIGTITLSTSTNETNDIGEEAQISIDRCSINYNGSIEHFRTDLELEKDPRLMITDENRQAHDTDQSLMRRNKQIYHFENFGIWVFFDMNGDFSSLRFEEPFAGTVGGVKIGDSFETLEKVRGKPFRNDANGILYRENDTFHNYRTISGKIVRVFTNRCDRLKDG